MNILALDLSAKRTGWATLIDGKAESGAKEFPIAKTRVGKRLENENPSLRFVRFTDWLHQMLNDEAFDLVIFEAPSARFYTSARILLGFSTRVEEACLRREVQCVSIEQKPLKKWATGTGNADKDLMKAAAHERFAWYQPDDDPGGDEADALCLLAYAMEKNALQSLTAPANRTGRLVISAANGQESPRNGIGENK